MSVAGSSFYRLNILHPAQDYLTESQIFHSGSEARLLMCEFHNTVNSFSHIVCVCVCVTQ